MKVICFGSSGKDMFFPTEEGKIMETPDDVLSQKKISFELGAKYAIKERFETLGGCAANAAAGLSKMGIDTACASVIGSDATGIWIQEELKKNNVDTSLINAEADRKSNFSAIVVDKNSADRVIFSSREADGEIKLDENITKEAEWFFVSDIQGKWEDQLEKIF
jgi:sugar/nucleoside kinase (ribokinase family)